MSAARRWRLGWSLWYWCRVLRLRAVAPCALLVGLAGCFTVDGSLARDGSGRLTLTYFPGRHATRSGETRRFSSPHVTLESLEGSGQAEAVARVRFDDAARLSSAEAFHGVTVTRERAGDSEVLRIAIANDLDPEAKANVARYARENPTAPGPHVTLTLPGRVLAANRGAAVDGSRVAWRLPLDEYVAAPTIELEVRYAVS